MAKPTGPTGPPTPAPDGTPTRTGGNPFTNTASVARQHANANAAFMRATRPGNAGDAGGSSGHPFDTTGEPHPFDGAHPDASLFPSLPLPPLPRV